MSAFDVGVRQIAVVRDEPQILRLPETQIPRRRLRSG